MVAENVESGIPPVGDLIKELVGRTGVTVNKLAKILSPEGSEPLDTSYIGRVINSNRNPTVFYIDTFAQRYSRNFDFNTLDEIVLYMSIKRFSPSVMRLYPWVKTLAAGINLLGNCDIPVPIKNALTSQIISLKTSRESVTRFGLTSAPLTNPEFVTVMNEFQEKAHKSIKQLAMEIDINPSMLSRIKSGKRIGKRSISRRDKVERIARALNLKGIDEFKLMLASGYATPTYLDTYPWVDALVAQVDFFNNTNIPRLPKDMFAEAVMRKVENWQEI